MKYMHRSNSQRRTWLLWTRCDRLLAVTRSRAPAWLWQHTVLQRGIPSLSRHCRKRTQHVLCPLQVSEFTVGGRYHPMVAKFSYDNYHKMRGQDKENLPSNAVSEPNGSK